MKHIEEALPAKNFCSWPMDIIYCLKGQEILAMFCQEIEDIAFIIFA